MIGYQLPMILNLGGFYCQGCDEIDHVLLLLPGRTKKMMTRRSSIDHGAPLSTFMAEQSCVRLHVVNFPDAVI
jgi:hypothetical protein